mgnify:CR=1 FL=1
MAIIRIEYIDGSAVMYDVEFYVEKAKELFIAYNDNDRFISEYIAYDSIKDYSVFTKIEA